MKKQWPYFLLAFVIPVTAVLWWWGLFSAPEVETGERGAYRYAYLDAQGAYSKLESKQKEVRRALDSQGIAAGPQITVMQSDPRTTQDRQHGQHGDANRRPTQSRQTATAPQRPIAPIIAQPAATNTGINLVA